MIRIVMLIVVALSLPGVALAQEQSLKKYTPPPESKKDEPLAKQFSLEKAAFYLDGVALQWTQKRGAAFSACHTNSRLSLRPSDDLRGGAGLMPTFAPAWKNW